MPLGIWKKCNEPGLDMYCQSTLYHQYIHISIELTRLGSMPEFE